MSLLTKDIGKKIKRLRMNNELTQEKLAELADLNVTFIGTIERGNANPTIETLERISCALGTSVAELVCADSTVFNKELLDIEIQKLLIEYAEKIKRIYKKRQP